MKILFLNTILVVLLLSFGGWRQISNDLSKKRQTMVFDFTKYRPQDLIKILRNAGKPGSAVNRVSFEHNAPADWIKKSDIAFLITLINSKDTANCLISPLSSQSCVNTCYSTVGGHAIDMIESYRQQTAYPRTFFNCPQGDANKVMELNAWWVKNRH